MFFKISQKTIKRKHYKLIVHWKLSEIETLLQKTRMQVTAPKKAQPIRAERPNLGDDYP